MKKILISALLLSICFCVTAQKKVYIKAQGISGGGGTPVSGSNGITVVSQNITWGGILALPTVIDGSTLNNATFTSAIPIGLAHGTLDVNNTSSTGEGIIINTNGGTAMEAINNAGGYSATFSSSTGPGIIVGTTAGLPVELIANPSTTNTINSLLTINRYTSGTPGNGIGGSIEFWNETSTQLQPTNSVVSKLVNVLNASYTSQLDLIGYSGAAREVFANFQTGGIIIINNGADTVATQAYARSVGGGGGGGGGTLTTISVASANGFTGTVANPTTTPVVTMRTSVTGVIKGNGTAISAATAGTDFSGGTSGLGTGILKSTTGTGGLTIAIAADFPVLNQNTSGNAATATLASTVTTNANLTGEATSVGNAVTLTNSAVIAKVLTGYTSGAGTVSSSDNILQAVQKLNGNIALKANLASPTLTGTPLAPTAASGTNTTQIATTAFVQAAIADAADTLDVGYNLSYDTIAGVKTIQVDSAGLQVTINLKGLTATSTLNFPSTTTNTSSELTITVTGAVNGDDVVVSPPATSYNANSCFTARVSSANTVSIAFNNYSTGTLDPNPAVFKVTVLKF